MHIIMGPDTAVQVAVPLPISYGVAALPVGIDTRFKRKWGHIQSAAIGYAIYASSVEDGPTTTVLVPIMDVVAGLHKGFDVTLAIPTLVPQEFSVSVAADEKVALALSRGLVLRGPITNPVNQAQAIINSWLARQDQVEVLHSTATNHQ